MPAMPAHLPVSLPRDAEGVDEDHIALRQNVQMGRQRSHAIRLPSGHGDLEKWVGSSVCTHTHVYYIYIIIYI